MQIRITVNGREHQAPEGTTLQELLSRLDLVPPFAVELNRQVCPKKQHAQTVLRNGDVLEIVTIVGGG